MAATTTRLGKVEGIELEGCERYGGIPYARPPVGPLRFRPPVPVEPWDGVLDATAFGASAPQPPPMPGAVGVARDLRISEDCLFLNVWTPRADDGRRPVMVWVHGGAYTMGSGDLYDGATFARRGDVVVVTLNYRLGVLGWAALDHLDPELTGAHNNGLRDQIEALRWVRDNIGAFGGDPGNVTLFGESAGGGSVAAIIAAPEADGLYARAIIESGAPGFDAHERPGAYADEVLDALGAPEGGIDRLRSATVAELLQAQLTVGSFNRLGLDAEHPIDGRGPGPHPLVDGVVVTRTFVEAITEKGDANVPLIIGTNLDEGTLFTLLLPQGVTDEEVAAGLAHSVPDPQALVARYAAMGTGRPLLVDLMTDAIFLIPSLRGADAQAATAAPVWVYLFTWRTPVFGGMLGATHALELPFVWNMVDDPAWVPFVGADPPRALATAMQDAWLAFARTGDPNTDGGPAWPRYDTATRPTLELGDEVRVVEDPRRVVREAWDLT